MSDERVIEIEAFRVGPASRGITEREVDEAVDSYTARADKGPAPLVLGHPQSDDPARGLIATARREGQKLFLGLKNIADDVVQSVRKGEYINRSIKFWHPTDPANPTPGKWDIRHLGLLGAAAPGIPGMSKLAFSTDETAIESETAPAAALVTEFQAGTEIVTIIEGGPNVADQNKGDTVAKTEFDALQTENDRLQGIVDATTAKAETDRKAANVAFVDTLIEQGRVTPGDKVMVTEILNRLPVAEVEFDADRKGDLAAEFKTALAAATPRILFTALSPKGERQPKDDPQSISDKAVEFKAEQAKLGRNVSDAEAVAHVTKGA